VAVYADRNYKKFEQVFINYGEKGNADLLLLYGFALDRNPFDAGTSYSTYIFHFQFLL
jgi:histone-lysine N-methyltransferase SETD3